MLQFFRSFFSSKLGLGITLVFLALIALAFASGDVANTGSFGGIAGGNRVAVVGDRKIGTGEMQQLARTRLDGFRRENPTLTMAEFVEGGGLEALLDDTFARAALAEWADEYGFRAGDRLIDSEIAQIPAFRGADGEFSQDSYNQILRQQGLSDAQLRGDIGDGLLARQIVVPVGYGARMPQSMAARYAGLFRERRSGAILSIPSAVFAPEGEPSASALQSFYAENRTDFIRPERRVLRYATFGADSLGDLPAPTDAQIAARYRESSAQYAASEERTFTQLVVPTAAAANALLEQVRGGASLSAAARSAGLDTTAIGPFARAELAREASPAVAQAGFEADSGALTAPTRGPLGYYVLQVTDIDRQGGRSLAEARDEIAAALATEQRRAALTDLAARIEEQFDEGSNLTQVARTNNLDLQTTRPVTADGRVFGTQDETAPQELAPIFATAFEMEEGEPQVSDLDGGQTFIVFEAADVIAAAAPPLAEVRDQVVARYRLARGSDDARAAADRILARVRKGSSLAQAAAAEERRLPAPDAIDLSREQLNQQAQQGRIPPPLALLFSMAEGTVKRLEGPDDAAWFVVALDEIEPGEVDANLVGQFQRELSQVLSDEYVAQFRKAVAEDIGVERNEDAIRALRDELIGSGN